MIKLANYVGILSLYIHGVFGQETTADRTTVAFKESTTVINCPIQQILTVVYWTGPPDNILYYDPGLKRWNERLGEKLSRLSIATNQSIILTGTKLTDAAVYTCATEIGGKIYNGINNIQVRARADLPVITASAMLKNSHVLATEGESVTVNCTSRGGYPVQTVELSKEPTGHALPGTVTTDLEADGTYTVTLTYTFSPTRHDDQQLPECRSYWLEPADAQDVQRTNVTLYLFLKPSQPTLTPTNPVVAGSDITVECRTNGARPAATMFWIFRVETLAGVTTVMSDSSTKTYTTVCAIQRRVTSEDNGHHLTCKVSHLTGEWLQSMIMDVQFSVPSSSTRLTGNRIIESNGANPLNLTCITGSSNPASIITWKKGNSPINSDSSYIEQPGENNGTIRSQVLTLRPLRTDSGETVTCSVSNNVSQIEEAVSVTLDLHYSPFIITLTDQTVVEGDKVIMKCSASSKPAASFSWAYKSGTIAQGSGTASYNGLDYTITAASRSQAGTYTCTAANGILPNDSKHMRLVVQYPPDVVVSVINTTVHSHSATLTCGASGVPDQYTYGRWMHTFNGVQVLHPEPLPASRDLELTGLSYAHSGVYRCGASNGVKGAVSYDEGTLMVKSFPIFIGDIAISREIIAYGQLMKPTVIYFQFYSNAGSGYVEVLKVNGIGKLVGDVHQRSVDVKLPVFLSEIVTPGTEVTISITVTQDGQFGDYQIIVMNEMDRVNLSLIIRTVGSPETPHYVHSASYDYHSVIMYWVAGHPNGLNQTFVIQISTDNSTWRNITQYGGMSVQQMHTQQVDNLASSQLYFWRMLAVNGAGESPPTRIGSFETTVVPATCTGISSGVIVGALVGTFLTGALTVAAIVAVVAWKWRRLSLKGRRTAKKATGKRVSGLELADKQTQRIDEAAVINTASNEAQPPYETLNAAGDAQGYEQLHRNRTVDPDTIGVSPYEDLQTNREDNTHTYQQLSRNEHQPKVYENLEVSSM